MPALAQPPVPRQFNTADGLADNTVQCVAQDAQGFLWAGTQDGLSRFDGSAFRTFRADARRPGTLAGNFVRALAPAPDGSLWVGTGSGLCRYDPHTEQFTPVPLAPGTDGGPFVHALLANATGGGVWAGTEDGLWQHAGPQHNRRYGAGAAAGAGVRRNSIRALARDAAGVLWAGTGAGQLCRFDSQRPPAEALQAEPRFGLAAPAPVLALAADPLGGLWVGTEGGALRYLPPAPAPAVEVWPARPGSLAVFSLRADAAGVWVAGAGGLRRCLRPVVAHALASPPSPLSGGEGELVSSSKLVTKPVSKIELRLELEASSPSPPERGLGGEANPNAGPSANPASSHWLPQPCLALWPDRSGQLWVGTDTGLRCFDLRPCPFGWRPSGPEGPLWAVAATPAALWLGTERGGLLSLSPRNGQVLEALRHRADDASSLADNFIRCVLPMPDGDLWVGTQRHGLDYRPAGGAGFRHFRHRPGQPGSLADDFVRCLYRDPADGSLWVGTEGGLCHLPRTDAANFRTYRPVPGQPGSLPNRFVRCVLRDRSGRLWVGTGGGGLARLDDPATGRFTTFRANARNERSLPGNFVRCLALDAAGRLWVGTEDGGLARCDDPVRGSFTTFGAAQGLPNNVVYSLLRDSATATIWASTNRGLARLEPITGRLVAYDGRDGLPQTEYNAGAGAARGGRLYFGGPAGLVSLRPAALGPPPTPPVLLTGLRRLNQPVALPDTALGQRRQLRLGPQDYVFTLEFAALDLRRAGRTPLLYRLDGFDPDWLAAGARPEATYTNLDPGRYTFRVRAADAPPGQEARLGVLVEPAWYGRWWFRLGLAVAVLLAGWAAYRLRVRQLLALERVRYRIARDLHDDMGSTLSSISMLSQVARRHQLAQRPEQATALLEQIGHSSHRMLDAMDDIVWAINPAHDSLEDVAARMREFAAATLEPQGVVLDFRLAPGVAALRLPMEARREFFLFFKEVVNNLAKYARATRATVELRHEAGRLRLTVTDDGVGFDPAAPAQGGGHGLPNLRMRATALRASFILDTEPGRGTRVVLGVPL